MTLSSAPSGEGSGWVGWVILAMAVSAFRAVTIAATLALFPTRPDRGRPEVER